jgi:hypothetical protein
MKKSILITLLLSLNFSLLSQDFKFKTKIDVLPENEFYNIDLQSNIVSELNNKFNDVKVKNEEGKEVPYFMKREHFEVSKRVFKTYQIKEKVHWKNGATVLVIENTSHQKINNLQLQIKNFDVRKRLELAGSDDYENWYTIKENYLFRSANGLNTTSEVKSLNFPYVDYKYYRIVIYDCFSLPINVLKVGYYDTYHEKGKFKQLNKPVITRFDSTETKETYIHINFKDTPYFDKLVFKVGKPLYYYRNARLCIKRKDKKGRVHYDAVEYLVLNSNSDLTYYFKAFNNADFYLVIDNEDNPPLENIELEAFQLKRSLIAYLEAGKQYHLEFGNEKLLVAPNYDIAHFKNKIGSAIPEVTTGNVELIKYQSMKKTTNSTLWIWLAIGLVAILLGYLSFKMITEMETK